MNWQKIMVVQLCYALHATAFKKKTDFPGGLHDVRELANRTPLTQTTLRAVSARLGKAYRYLG